MMPDERDADSAHAARLGRLDADGGVFQNDAALWRNAEFLGPEKKDLRIGLAAARVLHGDDRGEQGRSLGDPQDQVYVAPRGAGADRLSSAGLTGSIEQNAATWAECDGVL